MTEQHPHQPSLPTPAPKRRRTTILIGAMGATIVVLAAALAGSTQQDTAAGAAAPAGAASPQNPNAATTVTVTETVEIGGGETVAAGAEAVTVEVRVTETVTEVAAPPSEDIDPPPAADNGVAAGQLEEPVPVTWTSWDGSAAEGTVTVHRAERLVSFNGFAGEELPTQGTYLLLDVSYEITDGTASYHPYDWQVKDAEGREYDNALVFNNDEPRLSSGELTGPDKVRGVIVFDVPDGDLRLDFSTGFGDLAVSWELNFD